ncbi:hypothetical protein DDB_G0273241 [Dictyostelium discoideum AX4]|uniref:Uncharacterized protein n=1 Tax=Dictyostelium discoideum TaxID=44689 RepID=Q557C2_DICDI|nr:hypothetical protein DDB_G0273661 [Dictyostelium discoideum AX4]XP_644803.1 hypothetical protein DDB_G0273241 [Dictyostelium discoideum AX4]EAL70521.1 hypothetical protein DDB_G0273661 [Dictyostelium discoideum AX4]EAL70838.1 hypothetical protein DDB_G0273241 [Dictyostelium discoideum AX4]|eukprot:XP_644447.1 hypothetical protein DDB_G0273661 [Dictyostelium discoideum AX4]
MLKFLIAILVIISLLSNLNAVNGQLDACLTNCYKKTNVRKECPKGRPFSQRCKEIMNKCNDQCS